MYGFDDITILRGLVHEMIARNFILESALIGTWRTLIEKGIIDAHELEKEIDIISANYPSSTRSDPGKRILRELKCGIHTPLADYVENIFRSDKASNVPEQ